MKSEFNVGDVVRVLGCEWWFKDNGLDSQIGTIVNKDGEDGYTIEFDRGIVGSLYHTQLMELVVADELGCTPDFSNAGVLI